MCALFGFSSEGGEGHHFRVFKTNTNNFLSFFLCSLLDQVDQMAYQLCEWLLNNLFTSQQADINSFWHAKGDEVSQDQLAVARESSCRLNCGATSDSLCCLKFLTLHHVQQSHRHLPARMHFQKRAYLACAQGQWSISLGVSHTCERESI